MTPLPKASGKASRKIRTVKTDDHVLGGVADRVVVQLDVLVEQLLRVATLGLHALEHGLGTEVSQQRVIELNVAAAGVVQVGEFLAVGLGEVGKVFVCGRVHGRVERLVHVTEVVPLGSGEGDLEVADLLGLDERSEVLEPTSESER